MDNCNPCDLSNYTDFSPIVLDVGRPGDVDNPSCLEIAIDNPAPGGANRLLIFTGTAVVNKGFSEDDEIVRRGAVQVNLGFRLTSLTNVLRSATTAGLASVSNSNGATEDTLWAVDCVHTDPGPDPNNQGQQTLLLTAAIGLQGGDTTLLRMSYQANVLVQDLQPELESILVDNLEPPLNLQPSTVVQAGFGWRGRVTLTGPAPAGGTRVTVSSGDNATAPLPIFFRVPIPPGQPFGDFPAPSPTARFPGPLEKDVTITATLGSISKTASLLIVGVPK